MKYLNTIYLVIFILTISLAESKNSKLKLKKDFHKLQNIKQYKSNLLQNDKGSTYEKFGDFHLNTIDEQYPNDSYYSKSYQQQIQNIDYLFKSIIITIVVVLIIQLVSVKVFMQNNYLKQLNQTNRYHNNSVSKISEFGLNDYSSIGNFSYFKFIINEMNIPLINMPSNSLMYEIIEKNYDKKLRCFRENSSTTQRNYNNYLGFQINKSIIENLKNKENDQFELMNKFKSQYQDKQSKRIVEVKDNKLFIQKDKLKFNNGEQDDSNKIIEIFNWKLQQNCQEFQIFGIASSNGFEITQSNNNSSTKSNIISKNSFELKQNHFNIISSNISEIDFLYEVQKIREEVVNEIYHMKYKMHQINIIIVLLTQFLILGLVLDIIPVQYRIDFIYLLVLAGISLSMQISLMVLVENLLAYRFGTQNIQLLTLSCIQLIQQVQFIYQIQSGVLSGLGVKYIVIKLFQDMMAIL